jgi:hypothetical protein
MATKKTRYSSPRIEDKFDPNDLESVHKRAMEDYKRSRDAEELERERCQEDAVFCDEPGGQWGRKYASRDAKRPRLEMDNVRHMRNIVVGDFRQNRIGAKVRPADNDAKPELADAFTGLIRNKMNAAQAKAAIDNAFQSVATTGIGALQLCVDYASPDTFDQDFELKPIHDAPATIWPDANSTAEDHRDARHMHVIRRYTPQAFRDRWPDAKAGNYGFIGVNGPTAGWRTIDYVQVSDYYIKESYETELVLFSNGETYREEDLKKEEDGVLVDVIDELAQFGITEVRRRKRTLDRVWHYKVSGCDVLDGPNEWVGQYIPVIIFYGYHGWNDGRHWYHGIVRSAKDPQRFHNYVMSSIAERCSKSVKDFYWMTPEQMGNFKDIYQSLNTKDRPVVPFNHDPRQPGGPIPSRQATMDPNLTMMLQESVSAIHRATGLYAPSLGDNPLDQSGRAILAQQKQGDMGTYILVDNFAKGIEFLTEQCIDVMPRIYDNERQVRVMGESGEVKVVTINQEIIDEQTKKPVLLNDVSVGKYDVVRDTGPSFNTKRAEALDFFQKILQTNLPLAQVLMDFMAKWVDAPYSEEMEGRISWWMGQQGLRPPTPEEQQAMAQKQPSPQEIMQLEGMKLELEKLAVEIDEKDLGNEKTRAEIAEIYAKVADITEKLKKNEVVTPGEMQTARSAMNALESAMNQAIISAEANNGPEAQQRLQ